MSNKGQWFLIISIFIIIILALLKTSINILEIMEKKRYLEMGFEKQEFQNVRDEVLKTVEISFFKSQNISKDVNDFVKNARIAFDRRSVQLNGFFVEIIFSSVTANVDTRLNVTILNLLGTELRTLNLTFNGTTQNFTTVRDLTSIETNFTFRTDTTYNYTLTAFYQMANENKTESINIPVEIGKSKFIGFFDIRLITERTEQRDKFTKIYTLSE